MSSSDGSVGYVAPRHPQRPRSAMLRAAGARVNPDRIPEGDEPPRALRRRERALAVRVVIDRVSKTYVDRRGQAVEALGDVTLTVERLTGWRRRLQVEMDEVMVTGVSSRGS